MYRHIYLIATLLFSGLFFLLELPTTTASNAPEQALLHVGDDGSLYIETANDQNVTFRLMGDASTLLLNDMDILTLLEQRQRVVEAAQSTAVEPEPLSLDALKEQFRGVQRDLTRLARWISNMRNGTRRSGLTQRVLRRTLQRVQLVGNTLQTLESNLLTDECSSNPCKHGGTCIDSYKSFHCNCPTNWQGATCEDDVNECFDLAITDLAVCKNNAQCINTPGSYRCICRPGYSGTHCQLQHNVCLANQSAELCGSHGTCLISSNAAGFVCICDQGWTWADTNVSMASASPCTRDVDECAPEINPCHNECINLPGSFRCGACPPGYTGDGKYCRDTDECADGNNGGCSQRPRVSCINTEGSYRCGPCPRGWTGDGKTCEVAKSNSCNGERICHPLANCEYISDTVVCSCPVGYFGHGYGDDGCTEDADRKPCDDHPCLNNGTCVLSGRGTSCICQPGYKGALCNESDACHPNPCQNDGICRLLPDNEFMCVCGAGYSGSTCSNLRSFCGIILRNETGSLQFPPSEDNSQMEYQPRERCPFIIATRRGMILNVTFGLFDLESSNDCTADFLQLHDGSSLTARLIGRFCGNKLPRDNGTVMTTQEQMFLWFQSNNATQGRGFNLTWSSKPMVCGEHLNLEMGQSGVLRSPSYPGKTRPGINCRWHLEAPFGTRLLLHFYEINLGLASSPPTQAMNCSNGDYLKILDSDQQLFLACQSEEPEPLYSSSNQLNIHFHTDLLRMDSSFQLHYEVVKGHPNCGGIFTEPRGLITGHMITPVCLYLIQQPTGTQIEIKFDRVRFLTNGNCQLQRLEIFDGRTEDGRLLKRFCGQPQDSELQPIISSGNVVLMRYEYALAGLELPAYNFQLRYSRVCNVNFTEAVGGIITTPNYPNGYLENMDCIFNIVGPLNRILYINITDLSLSGTQLSDAPQDDDDDDDEDSAINVGLQPNYLDVYLSRNDSEKQRFTKNLTNFVLASTNNQLRLIFHGANNPQRARGLRVEYKIISGGCGGVLTAPKMSLTKLLNGMPCQWIIEVPGRKHLRVSSRVYMRGFAMYIYDNSTSGEAKLLRSFEQQNEDRNFQMNEYTDSNLITIYVPRMSTLSFLRIEYEPAEQTCGGSFQSHYGIIKTPNWPEHYGSSENCTWVIMASMGERIELIVHNFTLESTKTCRDDYLEIRNGDNVGSPLLGRYCGSSIPSRFPSFGNALYLHFQSDAMVEKQGFYLNWQLGASGCGGKLTSMNGAIHSPHSIADNSGAVSCDWQISVSLGSTVYMELQSRDDLCKGLLIIYDGPTTRSPKLKMNCSDNGEQMKLLSSGHQVLVRYDVHEDSPEGLSFVLDYSTNCRTRLEQLHGAIETPNFPENYPPNTNCEWDIRSGEGSNHVQLSFSHIHLENEDSNCETDYVLLRDYRDNQLISERRLCVAEDEIISSVGNRLLMQFKSDGIMENQGFHAEYRRLGCGEELQVNETSFETPNAPYSVDLDCYWHITVPEGYQISLLLQELHIETTQRDCSQDSLTIWAGTNASDVILRSCQVESSTQTYLSPANELHVRFRSSPQRARKYLKASYSQLPARCGGYVSASSGVIASPSYYQQDLDIYDKDIECVWTIEVTDSYGIQLDFETFNLTGNCQKADLQVSGSTTVSDAEYVQQECGGDHIDSITLKNKVKVHFKAKAGSWGKFAIRYQQICGGIRIADEGYLNSRLDTTCYWTIQGPEGSKISLNINQMECPACTAPAGNCTAGLRVLNAEDEVTYYNLCKEHPATVMVPTNKARIEAVGIVLSAQYTTIDNTCGGNITSARGTLSSPNYPESYPANVECDWVFKPRAGNAFELNFVVMDIAKSEHCNVDFLEVRSDHHGPLLGLYCGNDLPVEPIVSSTEIWIKFRSLPGSSGNGFKLHWSYVHDIELNGTSGIIESPPTLLVRGDEQPYTWRIFPELNSVIVMDFREYNTGLQLFDGFDETGISIDIGNSPWQFISSNNVLYLKTVNTDFDAFRLEWKIMQKNLPKEKPLTEVCNMLITLDKETEMEINTPNYPHKYNPIMNCEWTFKPSDVTRHVVINLSEANLGSLGECGVDYLSIETSSNLVNWQEIVRACNMSANPHKTPLLTVHGTPNLKVKFATEKLVNGSGFSTDLYTDCGSNMTEPVGTITSSNLQRSLFAGSAICEWHIDVRPGRVIDINIEYNGKPLNINCMHYGLIYDGLDAGAPLLPNGKFCNQLNMSTGSYRTSGPHAFIRYYMPTNINNTNPQRNNWTLTYREYRDCHNEIQLTHLASSYALNTPGYPDYPQTFADCIWLIRAPVGETIAANFVDAFDLSTHDCDKEFVELFDGSTMLARRLLRTCRRPGTQRSTGNTLLVHYESTITDPHFGFKLNVSLSQCGGQHIARTGIITSEHYPALGAYPKPADCEYTIKSYKNSHLIVNISDIHLPYDANAKAEAMDRIEFLDLMDQRRIMLILYGNETNLPYTTTLYSYEVAVRFVATSTKLNIYRGFRLEYKSKDMVCTRSTDAASGEMEIRRAVIYVKNPIDCRWHITVPKGQRVRLEIVNLSELRSQLPGEHPIDLDFSFYNDYRQFSEIINFNIKSYNGSGIIESSDNVMTVSVLLYREMTRKTIRMRFSSNEASPCPPDIGKQAAGMVSNQELINMPTYYCSIKLLAEPFETISFKTVYSQQGGNGYVDFNNDNPWTRETLPRGNATIATAMKSGYIVISQSALSDHLRFQATYKRYPCGGHFKLTEGLIIELPELTEHFGVLECMWTLDNSGDFGIRTLSSFSDSCDNEYVELHLDNKLSRYCRNDVQTFNLTRGADIYKVHYHATQYHSRISSFQLLATKYNYLSGQGEIANLEDKPTPPVTIDRTTYKNNIELSWEFQTNQYMTLQLEFRDRFFIELAPNCRNDQLEVLSYQSDLWQPIATLCGRELPQPLHVQSNRMRIVFRTNGNITGDGFTFVVTPTCDVKLEATSELQTVNGGRGYQGKFKGIRQCKYEFTTNSKHPLVVVVKGIDGTKWTELTCRISSFKAYRLLEGKPENEQLISNKLCPEFEISGLGYLRVVSTATAIINKPFQLQYQVIGCGDNYTTPFILRTPLDESGDFYKRSFNCEWHVLAPPQHAIFLSFQYFELEKECQFDKLFIYRGRSQNKEQRVSELCGNITAASIMIDSNEALIVANLPGYSLQSGRGFLATVSFTPNCNEHLALDEGNNRTSLVRQYHLNGTNNADGLHCYFRASAPPGYRLSISLKQLQLNVPVCATCSSLEIIDGFDTYSPSLGTYYATMGNGTKLFSSTNELLIKLSGSQPSESISFELMLQMEATICGQVEYKLERNEIINIHLHSNNISANYEGNIHCVWHFTSESDILIDMHAVQLPDVSSSTRKCIDYLLIKGIYVGSKTYCGQFNNTSLYVMAYGGIDIIFHGAGGDAIFAMDFSVKNAEKCNRTLTLLDGALDYYSSEINDTNNCVNVIRVPPGFSIALELEAVQFMPSESTAYLNITDLRKNINILNATEGYQTPVSILGNSNVLRIATSGVTYLKLFYHSNLNILPPGCGGELTSLDGQFANPNYDNRDYSECNWRISVPAGNLLRFAFKNFDMGPLSNCQLDNMKFYELLPDNSEILRQTFCGQGVPEDFITHSNRFKIVAKKSPNFVGTGFQLYYYSIYA